MRKENISRAVGNIRAQYIQEAENYTANKSLNRTIFAAILVLCFIAGGIAICLPSQEIIINAYAYGTEEEITKIGAVIHTGTISDNGEMKGHPFMFYLLGDSIESIRFSCKNQQLSFVDWTEKREDYGLAQNFTIPYGENESEYYYLTIDWTPNETIRVLTDDNNSTIATLPQELKEDLIVMEITFADGKSTVKAITVSLLEDGTFFAKFDDYEISDADTFITRTDDPTLQELSERKKNEITTTEEISDSEQNIHTELESSTLLVVEETAKAYYQQIGFEVISIEIISTSENEVIFSTHVSRNGILQEPNRMILLQLNDGIWEVVNEGY